MQADIFTWKQKAERRRRSGALGGPLPRASHHQARSQARQVVRLAMVQAAAQRRPGHLPDDRARSHGGEGRRRRASTVTIALAFSLPVFITPAGAKSVLACIVATRCGRTRSGSTARTAATAYANPRGFALEGAGRRKLATRDSGGYILPGIKREFDVKRAEGRDPRRQGEAAGRAGRRHRPRPSTSSSASKGRCVAWQGGSRAPSSAHA